MKDSSVYIVSPPTLYLPSGGLSFCLIGNDPEWRELIINMLEKGLSQNQLTFYVNDTEFVDPKAWTWYWHVAQTCNLIICDTLHSTEQEIRTAMALTRSDTPVLFQIKPGDEEFAALLHTASIGYYETVEQLDEILEAVLG